MHQGTTMCQEWEGFWNWVQMYSRLMSLVGLPCIMQLQMMQQMQQWWCTTHHDYPWIYCRLLHISTDPLIHVHITSDTDSSFAWYCVKQLAQCSSDMSVYANRYIHFSVAHSGFHAWFLTDHCLRFYWRKGLTSMAKQKSSTCGEAGKWLQDQHHYISLVDVDIFNVLRCKKKSTVMIQETYYSCQISEMICPLNLQEHFFPCLSLSDLVCLMCTGPIAFIVNVMLFRLQHSVQADFQEMH